MLSFLYGYVKMKTHLWKYGYESWNLCETISFSANLQL